MIQRKQTLYLFFGFLILLSLFFLNLGTFSSEKGIFELRFYGLTDVTDPENPVFFFSLWPLAVLVVVPAIVEFLIIFLFKNRPLQMRLCGINVGLQLGETIMMIVVGNVVADKLEVAWNFDYTALFPVAAAVLSYIAYRAIDNDEAIIRALNRLR